MKPFFWNLLLLSGLWSWWGADVALNGVRLVSLLSFGLLMIWNTLFWMWHGSELWSARKAKTGEPKPKYSGEPSSFCYPQQIRNAVSDGLESGVDRRLIEAVRSLR